MLEKLIASQQILTFEEWYKIMYIFYNNGLTERDPHADYDAYVEDALSRW